MDTQQVREAVGNTFGMTPDRGEIVYDFIVQQKLGQVLELGFAHGTSTCYFAAAVDELGEGHVHTFDMDLALEREPNIHTLLQRCGLAEKVSITASREGYLWDLMKLIEQRSSEGFCEPLFDFVYLDGAHTWDVDGHAFFLADKLLKPGGWMLFDDLSWTVGNMEERPPGVSDEQLEARQVEAIFRLLVLQHPGYDSQRSDGDWGWARKRPSSESRPDPEALRRLAEVEKRVAGQARINQLKRAVRRLLGR